MDAKPLSIGKILSERQRFVVPIYQRTYGWSKREIDPLVAQITGKADELLGSGAVAFSHYMGALLLIPDGEPVFGRIARFHVVDGQQRLTTFHLCFASLREIARTFGFEDLRRQISDLILHGDETPMTDRANERYKLEPTRYDRALFRRIIDSTRQELQALSDRDDQAGRGRSAFYKKGTIRADAPEALWAYWHFCDEFARYAGVDSLGDISPNLDLQEVRRRIVALSTVLFEHFRLIVITLSKGDDAQVIFETLNSGGKPLAAMDLVRNDVFYRANRREEDQETLLEAYWSEFEQPFWKAETTQGRIKKPRIDFFLSHALAAEQGRVMALGELYSEYKAFVRSRAFPDTTSELAVLTKYAPVYERLVNREGSAGFARLGRRLATFDVSTAYPLVLFVAASDAEEAEKDRLYDLIASFIIRRALCYLTAANYNNVFVEALGFMRLHGVSERAFGAFFDGKKESDTSRFPADVDLSDAIHRRPQYGWMPQNRLRLILEELEFAARDKFNVSGTLQEGLQVEHIMPRSWMEHWPLSDGAFASLDAMNDAPRRAEIEGRDAAVHRLGNLTLLTPPANASAGNSGFGVKRSRLAESLLKLNVDVAAKSEWTEALIDLRAERMAALAVRLWPAPAGAGHAD